MLGFLLLWFALRIGQGELRLYMLTGVALGALLYSLTLPPLLRPLWDFWLDAAVAFFSSSTAYTTLQQRARLFSFMVIR